jgi:SAM-dependent methyltransferase
MTTPSYDRLYAAKEHYKYRRWLYVPFVRALLRKAVVRRQWMLDLGCGQGQFSGMIEDAGNVCDGIDISKTAIETARLINPKVNFYAKDVLQLGYKICPAAIFTRALSLYNTPNPDPAITAKLFSYVRPGGVMLWLYPSRLKPAEGQEWRWHTLDDARRFFAGYDARVYYTTRLECRFLGRWAFSAPVTFLTSLLVRLSGHRIGGEIVVIVRKP